MATTTTYSPKADSVDEDTIEVKREPMRDNELQGDHSFATMSAAEDEPLGSTTNSPHILPRKMKTSRSSSSSTVKSRATSASSLDKKEIVDTFERTSLKMESSHSTKPSRSTLPKTMPHPAPLFDHLADSTLEAKTSFAVLDLCTYTNKFLGYTEHAMECDCSEEWGKLCTFPVA